MPQYGDVTITRWVSALAEDPHTPGTHWHYDAKWGLEWSSGSYWSTDLSKFMATPARVALWYKLMRECYDDRALRSLGIEVEI